MPRSKPAFLALLPLAGLAGPAAAYDPIVEELNWPQVAYDRDGACEAEVRGNGKFFLVNAVGLGPDASGRYYLTNQDMPPIDWSIVADGEGGWSRYYIPVLPGHEAGTVRIALETGRCSLDLMFDWDTYDPANHWASIRSMGE